MHLASFGQGIIGGNQNGLGEGGYLPTPPAPVQPVRAGIVTTLTTPGYEFDVIKFSLGSVTTIVDPTQPIAIPLNVAAAPATATTAALAPGFWATFHLANNTLADRAFTFPFQFWADNKVTFRVYNSNEDLVWQSVPGVVDPPPNPVAVTLTLKAKSSWRASIFVPFNPGGTFLPDGQYQLTASLSGTPVFSATASFEVKNVTGGPIVLPPPLTSGIKGLAQVGPVTPVSRANIPNVAPLPGAIIKVTEIRKMGVLYIRPPFTAQAVADDQGAFSIDAPPGSYSVTGLPPNPGARFPRGSTQSVEVLADSYTQIVVNYDSGIR